MRKILLVAALICFIPVYVFAQKEEATTAEQQVNKVPETTMKGVIIDNKCASSVAVGELSNFVATHTKECALMPDCAASGYSFFSGGKLYKFGYKSNPKVLEWLKKPDSKLQVEVIVQVHPDHIRLKSIKNQ